MSVFGVVRHRKEPQIQMLFIHSTGVPGASQLAKLFWLTLGFYKACHVFSLQDPLPPPREWVLHSLIGSSSLHLRAMLSELTELDELSKLQRVLALGIQSPGIRVQWSGGEQVPSTFSRPSSSRDTLWPPGFYMAQLFLAAQLDVFIQGRLPSSLWGPGLFPVPSLPPVLQSLQAFKSPVSCHPLSPTFPLPPNLVPLSHRHLQGELAAVIMTANRHLPHMAIFHSEVPLTALPSQIPLTSLPCL